MNGKLLVLCDELPGEYGDYSVKDCSYLKIPYVDPMNDSDRIFMCWDSIIPEDRAFIEAVKYYATFQEMPNPDFILMQRGAIDPAHGTKKTSIQEESYYEQYKLMCLIICRMQNEGKDLYGAIMDEIVQFPFLANSTFFKNFSKLLKNKNIVRILPTFCKKSELNITSYRRNMLAAWEMENGFMNDQSQAKILDTVVYDDFREVVARSTEELLKIYSLPIWGDVPSSGGRK